MSSGFAASQAAPLTLCPSLLPLIQLGDNEGGTIFLRTNGEENPPLITHDGGLRILFADTPLVPVSPMTVEIAVVGGFLQPCRRSRAHPLAALQHNGSCSAMVTNANGESASVANPCNVRPSLGLEWAYLTHSELLQREKHV